MTYNQKQFLLPTSIRSMACYHAKIEADHTMKLTIHDCNKAIRLHNNLNSDEEVYEAVSKLEALEAGVRELKQYIINNYMQ